MVGSRSVRTKAVRIIGPAPGISPDAHTADGDYRGIALFLLLGGLGLLLAPVGLGLLNGAGLALGGLPAALLLLLFLQTFLLRPGGGGGLIVLLQ